jgi:hypothetical protein
MKFGYCLRYKIVVRDRILDFLVSPSDAAIRIIDICCLESAILIYQRVHKGDKMQAQKCTFLQKSFHLPQTKHQHSAADTSRGCPFFKKN